LAEPAPRSESMAAGFNRLTSTDERGALPE
jgi:hypothetical protein